MAENTTITATTGEVKAIDSGKVGKTKKKKKVARQITHGRAYIQASYNNTIVTFTDLNGNALAFSTAGQCGFKGPKKATPYAAQAVFQIRP